MRRRVNKKRRNWPIWLILIPAFLLVAVLGFLLRTKYWNSREKLVIVSRRTEEAVLISVYDPQNRTKTNISIPAATQVLVAGGLGTWKLGSVWQLGIDEKKEGGLLTRTIAKNFSFPVSSWWEDLSLGDRLRIKIFELGIGKDVDDIDLAKTLFLRKAKFLDGSDGFAVNKSIPSDIAALFTSGERGSPLRAKIVDSSGSFGLAEKIGNIIEVMGIKVAVISKESDFESDCRISGKDTRLLTKLNHILGCSEKPKETKENFDLVLELGPKLPLEF